MTIRPFEPGDETAVISLWQRCDLLRPWNDPHKDIARKLAAQRELFLVGQIADQIVASVMAGYDGHRGWLYYLAVSPDRQRTGLGKAIVAEAARLLRQRGCPKINLQVRSPNRAAMEFYRRIGFCSDDVVSMGKRLENDD
jgi:ribosomal protein S18 acetylase RimI-like enzyme